MASPTALLTIRVWYEEQSEHPLRAQIRLTQDVSSGFEHTLTVAGADRVVEAVRSFLDEVVSSSVG